MVERSMFHLTNAIGTFHARVIAARLEAEGIRCELRGMGDWPWPGAGEVRIYVAEEDWAEASELLLFDRVEAVFQPPQPARSLGWRHPAWVIAVLLIVAAVSTVTRWF
jgi:hypothetical protein